MNSTLIIVGSNSPVSINRMFSEYVAGKLACETEILDMRSFDIPVFGTTAPSEGVPEEAVALVEKIKDYDSIIISSPEHNGSMPAAFKNLLDWMSIHYKTFFEEKPVLIMGVSPGPHGAKTMLSNLEQVVPRFKGNVIGVYSFGEFAKNFDTVNHRILNEAKESELMDHIQRLEMSMQRVV